MNSPVVSLFAAWVGLVSPVTAATPAAGVQLLPPVDVVVAPIVAETRVDGFGDQVTRLSADQVQALNAQDLAAALRRTPGVSIARYNPVGAFGGGEGGAVFVRGLGSSRPGGEIKTTFDGVPIGNGVFNHPLLDLLPLDLAGGVEVARRANPMAHGNMFAGVHLAAPRVAERGTFGRMQVSAGSFGAFGGKIEGGVRREATELYIGHSHRQADGHRPNAEGRLSNTLLRIAGRPLPKLELSYLAHHSDNRAMDPGAEAGSGVPLTRGDVYLTSAWLHTAGAQWERTAGMGRVKAYWNSGDGNWLRRTTSANADSLNDYRLSGVRWQEAQRPWVGGEFQGGVDVDWTRGSTVSVPPGTARPLNFGPETFRLASAYAGLRHAWDAGGAGLIIPSVGVRHYRHEQFGRATTPQASVVWRAGAWQAHASASRAVNFPGLEVAAFSTVAIPALGQSWRALRPERLTQSEIGVSYAPAAQTTIEVTFFRNEGRDRFVFVPPPPPPFRFLNVERFRTRGWEATVTTRPAKTMSLFAGVSYLDALPVDLPYAPEWTVVGGATWRIVPRVTLNLDGSYVAAQRSGAQARGVSAVNTEQVPAFALANARVAVELEARAWGAKRAEIFGAVENFLDRDYRYRPGYPMPGIGFTAGLSAGF